MKFDNTLLSPFQLNETLTLKNKIVMAPMTRCFATDDFCATQQMADYYGRRANAGLIITEGTVISDTATAYYNVPGIFNEKHIASWRPTTHAVHERDGKIFSQIWHVGRVSHPDFIGGQLPLAPSVTNHSARINRSELYFKACREATLEDIETVICEFANAANNAKLAGFDGVEIHGANGYLIDQFLHYHSNLRQDNYGGTPEAMAKFALDVVKACGEAIGYHRVGLRLSPGGYLNEMVTVEKDAEVFRYLLTELSTLDIAYLHTGSFDNTQTFAELENKTMTAFMRQYYQGTLIGCGSYTLDEATKHINQHDFDLVAIGRGFIANPDLIEKHQANITLNSYDNAMLKTLY